MARYLASIAVASLGIALAGCVSAPPTQSADQQCANMLLRSTPEAEVTSARYHPAGTFSSPPGGAAVPAGTSLPAFCQVSLTLRPTADSQIGMEAWLPAGSWNRKFLMVGNGGWSGSIPYPALVEGLQRHYAVVASDRGHRSARGTSFFGHPEKLIDFAWRATRLATLEGKGLTQAFYGAPPRYSYWNGCSSGGGQGLQAAQLFPDAFDGIIAGAPANNWINLHAQSIGTNLANLPPDGPPVLGPLQYDLLNRGAVAQCDGLDGLVDGEIDDPRGCAFDPASLACRPEQDGGTCLDQAQVTVARTLYAPARNARTGELVFPGMVPGSELNWERVVSSPWLTAIDTFALAHDDPQWDFRTFDMDADIALAQSSATSLLPALQTDLSAFRRSGGKLIMYHGWGDGGIPPESSINYYESVVSRQGGLEQTRGFARLFMVPGLGHCRGRYTLDWLTPLENWVERGIPPETVTALPVADALPPSDTPGMAATSGEARGAASGRLAKAVCAYPGLAVQQGQRTVLHAGTPTCRPQSRGARAGHRPE